MKKEFVKSFPAWVLAIGILVCYPSFLRGETVTGSGDLEKGLKADNAGNYSDAMKWYLKAADQGSAAECNMGSLYAEGHGVPQNYQEAMKWFQISAGQGNASAECNIGILFEMGRGVAQDSREAMKWFQMSASRGNALAEYNIGLLYAKGHGVPQDDPEAMKWYQKAAAQGFGPAQKVMEDVKKAMAK
jgi:uncharacterized protein